MPVQLPKCSPWNTDTAAANVSSPRARTSIATAHPVDHDDIIDDDMQNLARSPSRCPISPNRSPVAVVMVTTDIKTETVNAAGLGHQLSTL
jgi:hypothetical protein